MFQGKAAEKYLETGLTLHISKCLKSVCDIVQSFCSYFSDGEYEQRKKRIFQMCV